MTTTTPRRAALTRWLLPIPAGRRPRRFIQLFAGLSLYGVGMAISSAPPISFTADIKEIEGKPKTKRGRIPGAAPNERLVRVI